MIDSNSVTPQIPDERPIPVSTTGSGRYSLTPAEIQQQYEQCTNVLATVRNTYSRGRTYVKITSQISFLIDWQEKLQRAKDAYLAQEQLTESQWRELSSGMPSP
ncbi:MAG TPA: hypothetical protein VHX38_08205 [Pseudonocardiaceae bacterium]|nr:hypothetical protein [Pseudonocardiaceae bacterium]